MVPKVVDEEVDTQDRSVVDHFEPVPWNYNVNPLKPMCVNNFQQISRSH